MNVEYPRRFKKSITCLPAPSCSFIDWQSLPPITDVFPDLSSSRISVTVTSGILTLLYLSVSFISRYMPSSLLLYVATDGVALPSIRTPLLSLSCRRFTDTSTVSYLGVWSDLYVDSCSSSTTISPRCSSGANTADLAPMTISTLPSLIFFH